MSQTSEMTKPKTGEVSWNELVTKDTKGASNFYAKLFGWQSALFTPQGGANLGLHELPK
jgi:predicted enzyme related to lactoylglutathione lyase